MYVICRYVCLFIGFTSSIAHIFHQISLKVVLTMIKNHK